MSSLRNAGSLVARGFVRYVTGRLAMMALLVALMLIVGAVGAVADAVGAAPPPPPGSSTSPQQSAPAEDLVAFSDFYEIDKNQVLIVDAPGLLHNDTGPADKSVSRRWDEHGGRVTVATDGSFRFTPDQDFTGSARFQYEITDSSGASSSTVVTILVGSEPVAQDQRYETGVDEALVVDARFGLLHAGSDPGGDEIVRVFFVDDEVGGTLTEYAEDDGSFTFVPEPGFVGTASFRFQLLDSSGLSSQPATVYIEVVEPVDDPPADCDENGTCDPDQDTAGEDAPADDPAGDPVDDARRDDQVPSTKAPARTETPTYTG